MKNRFFIFVFLPTVIFLIVVFWIKGMFLLDPDFGWHLKLGELIVKQGFPKTDPFSYSMPSYPFVDYEWGSNVLIYVGFKTVGTLGLAAIYAAIAVTALWLVAGKKDSYSLIPVLFGAVTMLGASGIRPQVISWLFLAILLKLAIEESTWIKWRWTFPVLMVLWINFHGSFPLGLIMASLIIALRWYQKKKINIQDIVVLFAATGAILINPYGWRNVYEVIRQMILGGELMRIGIQEWMPSFIAPIMSFWILIGLGIFLSWRYRKKISLSELGAAGVLAMIGMASLRNMSLFTVAGIPLLNRCLKEMKNEAKNLETKKRLTIFVKILLAFSVLVFAGEVILELIKARELSEESFYPKKAVEFLKKNNYSGRLFSVYQWGGYLIWKYPEKKVYIDGRMSNFVWKAPKGEADYVFREYLELKKGEKTINEVFRKYKVETVLLPDDNKESKITKIFGWLMRNRSQEKSFSKRLEEAGWVNIYRDSFSAIYRKSNN